VVHNVVTGAAGFVGSHLCAALLARGDTVRGVDCFTDYYSVARKEANVAGLLPEKGFQLDRQDLRTAALDEVLEGADVVYHLAGQPGVRMSWGTDFVTYVDRNVLATQRLLEACRGRRLRKLVYASSSSVYGDAETCPTSESLRPRPVSPYGVTKLAGEHLCELYREAFGVPTASLRFFTVYGPGQRPDMAFSRLVAAALRGEVFELYGDGTQTRDFTYVGDIVRALLSAAATTWHGVANVGGGSRSSMNEVVQLVCELAGQVHVVRRPVQTGDVRHTGADTTVARRAFGYRPQTSLRDGLAEMVEAERIALPAQRRDARAAGVGPLGAAL
jgi:nucleoside-diphosphate-sugar epimerase